MGHAVATALRLAAPSGVSAPRSHIRCGPPPLCDSPGRDRPPGVAGEIAVLHGELQIDLALARVGRKLGDQLALGGERLKSFELVLKVCHRRVPCNAKDTQPKPAIYVRANIVIDQYQIFLPASGKIARRLISSCNPLSIQRTRSE